MTKDTFNPDDVGVRNGNFGGLPLTAETAKVIAIPVPWDVTVSDGDGTSGAPKAILNASPQLDFYDEIIGDEAWKLGPFFTDCSLLSNTDMRALAKKYIEWLENGSPKQNVAEQLINLDKINEGCKLMVNIVQGISDYWLKRNKIVCVVGGDHSTPLGLIRALANKYKAFNILHIDAHMDLREAYEGFTYSHASIMHNALKLPAVKKLVQVGVRDFCGSEMNTVINSNGRINSFSAREIQTARHGGVAWYNTVHKITSRLDPDLPVYISFDIDGLEPWLCPHTGTPVPGGLDFEQVFYMLKYIVERGHKIIGFDLTEVSNDPWDASVGARALYRLSTLAASSWKSDK